jgi:hypothetical protein
MIEQSWQETVLTTDDDMSRRQNRGETTGSLHDAVRAYVSRLNAAGRNRASYEQVASAIETDKALSVSDVVSIALQYRGGGAKPASKKAAMEVIARRFLELVRDQAQSAQAAKARPW